MHFTTAGSLDFNVSHAFDIVDLGDACWSWVWCSLNPEMVVCSHFIGELWSEGQCWKNNFNGFVLLPKLNTISSIWYEPKFGRQTLYYTKPYLPDPMRAKIFIFVTLVYEVFDLPLVFKLKYANIYHKQADSNMDENDYPDLLNQWHNHCDLENWSKYRWWPSFKFSCGESMTLSSGKCFLTLCMVKIHILYRIFNIIDVINKVLF